MQSRTLWRSMILCQDRDVHRVLARTQTYRKVGILCRESYMLPGGARHPLHDSPRPKGFYKPACSMFIMFHASTLHGRNPYSQLCSWTATVVGDPSLYCASCRDEHAWHCNSGCELAEGSQHTTSAKQGAHTPLTYRHCCPSLQTCMYNEEDVSMIVLSCSVTRSGAP